MRYNIRHLTLLASLLPFAALAGTFNVSPLPLSPYADTEVTTNIQSWLYRPDWNLMRVTRRGAGAPVEWLSCDIKYSHFYIIVR